MATNTDPLGSLRSPQRAEAKSCRSDRKADSDKCGRTRKPDDMIGRSPGNRRDDSSGKPRSKFSNDRREGRGSGDSNWERGEAVRGVGERKEGSSDWASMVEQEELKQLSGGEGGNVEGGGKGVREKIERETDESVLQRREKQIEYGKSTPEYQLYRKLVPKTERTRHHPRTPDKSCVYSRRGFDSMVKLWRKSLHYWDPTTYQGGVHNIPLSLDNKPTPSSGAESGNTESCGTDPGGCVQMEEEGSHEREESSPGVEEESCDIDVLQNVDTIELGLPGDEEICGDDILPSTERDDGDGTDVTGNQRLFGDNTSHVVERLASDKEQLMVKEDKVTSVDVNSVAKTSLERDEKKSPLKLRDHNVGGGICVGEESNDDFDMYADL